DDRMALALTILLATSATLTRVSPVGRHGMLLEYFEHTSFANSFLLIALAWAATGRDRFAFALMGLAFDVNAFVSAWGLAMLVIVSLTRLRPPDITRGLMRLASNIGIALIVALPALVWIARSFVQAAANPFAGDYPAFLHELFPYHFFITAARREDL